MFGNKGNLVGNDENWTTENIEIIIFSTRAEGYIGRDIHESRMDLQNLQNNSVFCGITARNISSLYFGLKSKSSKKLA